ncbi:MAG TPA: hypothetical protein VGD67_09335 [Pseudonocardiaceae bacterium]
MSDGFRTEPLSIGCNVAILLELGGYLGAGRPDQDLAAEARAPRSHPEVGELVQRLTDRLAEQYQDVVALLAALATTLAETGAEHAAVDEADRRLMSHLLETTTIVLPTASAPLTADG